MQAPADPAAVERFHRRALGSRLSFTTVNVDAARASAAWRGVEDVFADVDRTMSRFRADSEISVLNRRPESHGDGVVTPRLYEALALSERARRATAGRFDPRVLADLERLGSVGFVDPDRGPTPPPGAVCRGPVLERVPRSRSVRLTAAVDLGGIGKGLALRWARERAREAIGRPGSSTPAHGLLIDAGGDLVMEGPAPDGGPWRVAIEDPAGGSDPVAVLEVADGAVATSSVRINRWVSPAGDAVHHVVDPATGRPAGTGLQSVTVWWSDPAWAEVWTKSLFVAGPVAIAREAEARGLAVWWVDDHGHLGMTTGARTMTIWA